MPGVDGPRTTATAGGAPGRCSGATCARPCLASGLFSPERTARGIARMTGSACARVRNEQLGPQWDCTRAIACQGGFQVCWHAMARVLFHCGRKYAVGVMKCDQCGRRADVGGGPTVTVKHARDLDDAEAERLGLGRWVLCTATETRQCDICTNRLLRGGA